LKTQDFTRLRIGILPEHPVADAKKFVLENFAKGDLETVENVLKRSAEAVRAVTVDGVEAAMARFN